MKAKNVETILRAVAIHYELTGVRVDLGSKGVELHCPPNEEREGMIAKGATLELALLDAVDRIYDAMCSRVADAQNAATRSGARLLELDALRTEIRKGVQS